MKGVKKDSSQKADKYMEIVDKALGRSRLGIEEDMKDMTGVYGPITERSGENFDDSRPRVEEFYSFVVDDKSVIMHKRSTVESVPIAKSSGAGTGVFGTSEKQHQSLLQKAEVHSEGVKSTHRSNRSANKLILSSRSQRNGE